MVQNSAVKALRGCKKTKFRLTLATKFDVSCSRLLQHPSQSDFDSYGFFCCHKRCD